MLTLTEKVTQDNILNELSLGDQQGNEKGWEKWERERRAKRHRKLAKNFQNHLQCMGVTLLLGEGPWRLRLATLFSSCSNGSSVILGDGPKAQKCSLSKSKCNSFLTGIVLYLFI